MTTWEGRVALVTGASRGIGRAAARALAARGASVVASARGDHADPVAEEIRASGGRAEARALDVTEPAAIEATVAEVVSRYGRLDILVNNAGITRDQLLLRLKREDWDAVLDTNLTAVAMLTRAALKPMIKQRTGRHRHGHDAGPVRGRADRVGRPHSVAAAGYTRGCGRSGSLSGVRRGVVYYGARPCRERRDVHVMTGSPAPRSIPRAL